MVPSQVLHKVAECLYRNGHGTYFAIVKIDSKQIKRSLKTDDQSLAKRRLSEFRKKVKGLATGSRSMSFEQLKDRWLAFKKPELKPRSYERLEGLFRMITPFFRGIAVRSVTQTHIEKWKIQRSSELSPRSFNYERDTLRQLFEYARLNLRIILENPADTVTRRKMEKAHILIPSKEQFQTLLAALRNEPRAREAALFVEFLGYSGLRLGEAREVCWRDVNFDLGSLIVTGGKQGTKNGEFRSIPLFSPLRRFLTELKTKHPAVPNTPIFQLDSAKKALITACKKSGLPQYGHHAMRHFFCSNAIEAGCDFKVIAGWLGHKDGGVLVAQTYGHLRNEHSAAMAQRITFDAGAVNKVVPNKIISITP